MAKSTIVALWLDVAIEGPASKMAREEESQGRHMKPALCTHKYTYPLDERDADILVRYTHQIIEGTDVVTLTGIDADHEAVEQIKPELTNPDVDYLIKDLADDLVHAATFRRAELVVLRVDPAFAVVDPQEFEWECR